MPDKSDDDSDLAGPLEISLSRHYELGKWTIAISGDKSTDTRRLERLLLNNLYRDLSTLGVDADPVRLQQGVRHLELISNARLKLADAWVRALTTYGVTSITEVSEKTGDTWDDTEATLTEMINTGVLLCLIVAGRGTRNSVLVLPAFQFDAEGHVLPVMSDIAQRLTTDWDTEARLLWLTSPSGWLVNQAPADLLATSPDTVLRALDLTLGAA